VPSASGLSLFQLGNLREVEQIFYAASRPFGSRQAVQVEHPNLQAVNWHACRSLHGVGIAADTEHLSEQIDVAKIGLEREIEPRAEGSRANRVIDNERLR